MGADCDIVGRRRRGLLGFPVRPFPAAASACNLSPSTAILLLLHHPSTTNRTNQTTALTSKLQRFSWKNLFEGLRYTISKDEDLLICWSQNGWSGCVFLFCLLNSWTWVNCKLCPHSWILLIVTSWFPICMLFNWKFRCHYISAVGRTKAQTACCGKQGHLLPLQ